MCHPFITFTLFNIFVYILFMHVHKHGNSNILQTLIHKHLKKKRILRDLSENVAGERLVHLRTTVDEFEQVHATTMLLHHHLKVILALIAIKQLKPQIT